MRYIRVLLAALTTAALAFTMSAPATANEGSTEATVSTTEGQAQEVTFEEYTILFDDLTESDVPRSAQTVDGVRQVTFEVEEYELTLVDPETVEDEGTITPYLGGGWDTGGPYITLNRTDQKAVAAGGSAAIAGAICLIPAVGQVACVVAGALVAVAAVYITSYGLCPGTMKVYVKSRTAHCI